MLLALLTQHFSKENCTHHATNKDQATAFVLCGLDKSSSYRLYSSEGGAIFKSMPINTSFPELANRAPLTAGLCRRIWPPRAWPMANFNPHTGHSWTLGFDFTLGISSNGLDNLTLTLLWLVQWPPSAWNDRKCRLHLLHSKLRPVGVARRSSLFPSVPSLHERSSSRLAVLVLSVSSSVTALKRFAIMISYR